MSSYSWSCLACNATVEAGRKFCHLCACPAESTVRQQEAHRTAYFLGTPLPPPTLRRAFVNNVSGLDLFRGLFVVPVALWSAFKFINSGTATFVFGRHATDMVEVTGPWSSLLGALSLLLCAVAMASVVVDYFDKRANENVYKRVLAWSLHGWVVLMVATCIVGWKLEAIRWAPIQ